MRASWTRIHSVLLGVILTVLLLLMLENLGSVAGRVSAVFKPKYNPAPLSAGPSSSWADIVATAEAEARKVDPNALLDYPPVFAMPAGDSALWQSTYTSYTSSLELVFSFVTPGDKQLLVTLEDAAPAATVRHFGTDYSSGAGRYRHSQELNDWLQPGMTQPTITPRDAVLRTWDEAKQRAGAQGIDRRKVIPQGVNLHIRRGKVPTWIVDYIVEKPQMLTPTVLYDPHRPFLFSAAFTVDAASGDILERNFDGN